VKREPTLWREVAAKVGILAARCIELFSVVREEAQRWRSRSAECSASGGGA
jgi:hypothetical protein